MEETKKTNAAVEEKNGIPRAALSDEVLTIDVDSRVETMEEQ